MAANCSRLRLVRVIDVRAIWMRDFSDFTGASGRRGSTKVTRRIIWITGTGTACVRDGVNVLVGIVGEIGSLRLRSKIGIALKKLLIQVGRNCGSWASVIAKQMQVHRGVIEVPNRAVATIFGERRRIIIVTYKR